MSDKTMSLRGRPFKVLFLATILGMLFSGFCFGGCLELIAWVRMAEYFDAPVGFKHTPFVGISAVGASALGPSFAALVMLVVPVALTTVAVLSSILNPRSTCSGSQGFIASFSAQQKEYFPG